MRKFAEKYLLYSAILPFCMMLLAGCAGSAKKTEPVKLNDISLAYSRLAAVQEGMVTTQLELEGLLRDFDTRDDLNGGWLTSLELCRYHMQNEDGESAISVCDDTWRRAELSNDSQAIFMTAVQLYRYRGDSEYLSAARATAATNFDNQLLAVVTQDASSIRVPELAHPSTAVRAHQYYLAGKDRRDDVFLVQAYDLFAETNNSRGMADTLYLRAQLAAGEGRHDMATQIAQRAMQILRARNDDTQAESIQGWLDNELAAR